MILDENLITRAVKTSLNELMLNENAETNNVNAAKHVKSHPSSLILYTF